MSRIDPSAAPRFRVAPSDSERLSEILARVPPRAATPSTGSPAPRARWRRRLWFWALLAAVLSFGALGLAVKVAPTETEAAARRILSAFGADADAVLTELSRLLRAGTELLRTFGDAGAEAIDWILQRVSNGEADDHE